MSGAEGSTMSFKLTYYLLFSDCNLIQPVVSGSCQHKKHLFDTAHLKLRKMGKCKEFSEDVKGRTADLHKLRRSVEAISKQVQTLRLSVQTTVCKLF